MSDDWRLRIEATDPSHAHALTHHLASDIEHDLERSLHDSVIVSVDEPEVFCYAGTREQAEKAEELVRSLAAEHGWQLSTELKHWHPTAEEWEDPDVPLPADDAAQAAEHAELIERERRETEAEGASEYEVRVEFGSHRDCVALDEQLRAEGLRPVRRWRFLVVGVPDEDAAEEWAEHIRQEAPASSIVTVEGTAREAEKEYRNPFAIFGGLGG
jgi:hypothetical protein